MRRGEGAWWIHIAASNGRGVILGQFYDTEYGKINDYNFHISQPIPTYYTSNCSSCQ